LCLVLLLAVPMVATAGSSGSCAGATAAVDAPFDLANILPSTVIPTTTSFFSCSSAFTTAEFCSQCWAANNQCSGPNCYFCTEICLGRLGCWVP
ncbi:MAG: hypothetical protein AAGE94_03985, partial [Acidobacteriota bacterium]